MGVTNPEKIMRNLIPVVMAGVLGIYGLIVAVILNQGRKFPPSRRSQRSKRSRPSLTRLLTAPPSAPFAPPSHGAR